MHSVIKNELTMMTPVTSSLGGSLAAHLLSPHPPHRKRTAFDEYHRNSFELMLKVIKPILFLSSTHGGLTSRPLCQSIQTRRAGRRRRNVYKYVQYLPKLKVVSQPVG